MTDKPRTILFLGTHGQYNIGDELLLETFLARLGTQNRYVINTYDKQFTGKQLAGRYEVELIDTTGDRVPLLRKLLTCDLLCFGGGSIIKELYASTGRNRYSTLLMILAVVTFANRIARKPIAMLNVGVGPITTPRGRRLAKLILSQVDHLTVRDAKSYATCLAVGLSPNRVEQTADAVFSSEAAWFLTGDGATGATGAAAAAEASTTTEQVEGEPKPLRVALNLNFHIQNPDNWELFLSRLAAGLLELHEQTPIELHALPMQAGFKEHDDAEILAAFAERVPGITMHQHRLTSHNEVARLIEDCDVLVSERLHAIVIAAILGVPTFVLAYDVKVVELAAMLDLQDWTIDINEPFESADLAKRLGDLIDRRSAVSVTLLERSKVLHAQASGSFAAARAWFDRATGR